MGMRGLLFILAVFGAHGVAEAMRKVVRPAGPGVRILKADPIASSGVCTPTVDSGTASGILRRFDIELENGTTAQRVALARGLRQIEKMAGGRYRPSEGAIFRILKARGCAQQTGTVILLRQGCGSLQSVAYYMHELGHYVGNYDRGELYGQYKRTIRSRCRVTRYAMKDWTKARARNEEFAEVFAAFLTHPNLLNKSCPSAFAFFRDKVFREGEKAGCDKGKSAELAEHAVLRLGEADDAGAMTEQETYDSCGEAPAGTDHGRSEDLTSPPVPKRVWPDVLQEI